MTDRNRARAICERATRFVTCLNFRSIKQRFKSD